MEHQQDQQAESAGVGGGGLGRSPHDPGSDGSSRKPERHLVSGSTALHFPGPRSPVSSRLRQYGLSARGVLATRRQELSHAIVDSAHGFPYSRKLEAHTSCVNALAFSSKDGRFLASGGDDCCIRLWDFYQDDIKTAFCTLTGPERNIFCLDFSAANRFLYCAGTCNSIFQYDVAYLGTPAGTSTKTDQDFGHVFRDNDVKVDVHQVLKSADMFKIGHHTVFDLSSGARRFIHERKVFEMSLQAYASIQRAISEDGTIRRYDWRQGGAPPSTQDIIQTENEVTDVKFHPTMEHLFADSDGSGRVFLRDTRMAFGSVPKRSNEGIIRRYNTKLTKKKSRHLAHPEASSITFDKDGTKLAVTFLHYLPTIYAVSDPDPLAVLSGKNYPNGTRVPSNQKTYSNSCTMKHGSFGGPGLDSDDMYAGGSDDFYCYLWKIPPLPQLKDQRQIFSEEKWGIYNDKSTIAFTEGRHEPKIIPVEISTPLDRLTGHTSIVNTALFHPHFLHVVTAGVERTIILHSPTPSSPCTQNLQRSPARVRELKDEDADEDRRNYYASLLGLHATNTESPDEERQTLSTFDYIIREEGEADVFLTRPWRSDGEESSDETNEEDSEEDDDDSLLGLDVF